MKNLFTLQSVFSFLHFCYCFLCLYVFYSLTLIHLFVLEFSCTERSLDCFIFFLFAHFFPVIFTRINELTPMCWGDVDIVRLNLKGVVYLNVL